MQQFVQQFSRKWEHTWVPLEIHKGFLGMGKGWDQKMQADIRRLEEAGYEMCSAIQTSQTTFLLFFKRQLQ